MARSRRDLCNLGEISSISTRSRWSRRDLANLGEISVKILHGLNKRSPEESWVFKAESFCIRYLWRTKRKLTETITEQCFSSPNKSVCQKLARSCEKWKSAKKSIYALFAWSPSIISYDWVFSRSYCCYGNLLCHGNKNNLFTNDSADFWCHGCSIKWSSVVIMTQFLIFISFYYLYLRFLYLRLVCKYKF